MPRPTGSSLGPTSRTPGAFLERACSSPSSGLDSSGGLPEVRGVMAEVTAKGRQEKLLLEMLTAAFGSHRPSVPARAGPVHELVSRLWADWMKSFCSDLSSAVVKRSRGSRGGSFVRSAPPEHGNGSCGHPWKPLGVSSVTSKGELGPESAVQLGLERWLIAAARGQVMGRALGVGSRKAQL